MKISLKKTFTLIVSLCLMLICSSSILAEPPTNTAYEKPFLIQQQVKFKVAEETTSHVVEKQLSIEYEREIKTLAPKRTKLADTDLNLNYQITNKTRIEYRERKYRPNFSQYFSHFNKLRNKICDERKLTSKPKKPKIRQIRT